MNELFNNLSDTIEKFKCALFQTVPDPDLTNSWCSAKRKAPLIICRLSLSYTHTPWCHTQLTSRKWRWWSTICHSLHGWSMKENKCSILAVTIRFCCASAFNRVVFTPCMLQKIHNNLSRLRWLQHVHQFFLVSIAKIDFCWHTSSHAKAAINLSKWILIVIKLLLLQDNKIANAWL